jgi:hypothetical protein
MLKTNNNLVSAAKVYNENKYAEFTTLFRIPFKEGNLREVYGNREHIWKDLLGSWADTCILALNMRMDSCVAMLFRNKDNILVSNEYQVIFKKANGQIHAFNHPSFEAMERMIKQFQSGDWEAIKNDNQGVRQLLKALYWIPEDERKDHGGFGFGQLISCLEEFTLIECNNCTIDKF